MKLAFALTLTLFAGAAVLWANQIEKARVAARVAKAKGAK